MPSVYIYVYEVKCAINKVETMVAGHGLWDHASNIYRVGGSCITKLETLIQKNLRISGAMGLGIACVQVFGVLFTSCLYKSLKLEHC